MSALQQELWRSIDDRSYKTAIRTKETSSGFAFSEPSGKLGPDALAEGALKAGALSVMIASSFMWFIPLAQLPMGMTGRATITAIAMFLGYGIFRYANRGFAEEYVIDSATLRIFTRNTNDEATLRRTIPLHRIEAGFIRRPANRRRKSQINLRLRRTAEPLQLVSGDEAELVPLLERIMLKAQDSTRTRRRRP